ncbi:hypothetical protein, partial [Phascolarctobacterium sp.]
IDFPPGKTFTFAMSTTPAGLASALRRRLYHCRRLRPACAKFVLPLQLKNNLKRLHPCLEKQTVKNTSFYSIKTTAGGVVSSGKATRVKSFSMEFLGKL